jgi:hypothetical protein
MTGKKRKTNWYDEKKKYPHGRMTYRFVPGKNTKCWFCRKILTSDHVIKRINGKRRIFCHHDCMELYDKQNPGK